MFAHDPPGMVGREGAASDTTACGTVLWVKNSSRFLSHPDDILFMC